MGLPMARRLAEAGHDMVVWNRTLSRAEPLERVGARVAASPREAAAGRDLIVTIVTDAPEVQEVLFGPDGAVAGAAQGTLFVDMSTIAPDAARAIGTRLAAAGHAFVDAPVTGGDVGAQQGTLSILVGGQPDDVARARPAFEVLGRRITHAGPQGAGQALKACNQILGAVNLMGVCEAFTLAQSQGLDLGQVVEALSAGAGGSWSLQHLGPRIAAGDFAPGFMVDLMQKDLRIVQATAAAAALALPAAGLAQRLFGDNQAHEEGRLGTQVMWKAVQRRLRGDHS